MTSRTLILKVLDELDLNLKKTDGAELEKLIKELQGKTHINIRGREGLFIISFQDKNPKLARDYVNILVRRYIEESTSSKREDSYGATKFITEQAEVFREKLQKSEDAVNAFKQGEGSIATMDPALLLKDINDSQERLDNLKITEAQLETVLSNMRQGVTVQSNLPALQKRLQELQLQYTDNYPEIIRVKDDIKALEAQTKSESGKAVSQERSPEYQKIASELRAIRTATVNLNANIARNRGLLQRIPAARSKLEDMEREKNSQKTIYEQMMARQGQSEVSKQMEVQDKSTVFRIVDAAVLPIKPTSPNRVKLIFMGIVAGIAGGFGLVLLKDLLDSSIKNADVAKQLGLPVLAVIPRIEEPLKLAEQSRRDLRLYAISGVYFMLILAVLILELLDITIISRVVGKIYS
jgi:polysaccharide chain length determinant protein (PEP-CTERM system associated)